MDIVLILVNGTLGIFVCVYYSVIDNLVSVLIGVYSDLVVVVSLEVLCELFADVYSPVLLHLYGAKPAGIFVVLSG